MHPSHALTLFMRAPLPRTHFVHEGWVHPSRALTLFMRVAESTVIFFPMDQLGCFTASAGVTSLSLSTGQSLPTHAGQQSQCTLVEEKALTHTAHRNHGTHVERGASSEAVIARCFSCHVAQAMTDALPLGCCRTFASSSD